MRLKRKRVRKGDCVNTLRGWKSGPLRVSKRGKSWLRECLRKRERESVRYRMRKRDHGAI